MRLCDLLEVVNADVWLTAYDPEGNVIFEGTYDEVPSEYKTWSIADMWTEHDEYSAGISFHLVREE